MRRGMNSTFQVPHSEVCGFRLCATAAGLGENKGLPWKSAERTVRLAVKPLQPLQNISQAVRRAPRSTGPEDSAPSTT